MFSVDIEGLDEVRRDFVNADAELSGGLRRSVAAATKEGAQEARTVHRYKDQTGTLTASIHGRIDATSTHSVDGFIAADAPYASYVEDGTKPHVIERRRALALHWSDAGGEHFAARVNHPGTQPHPFMGPAAQKAERVLQRELEVSADRAAKILEKP